MLKLDYGLYVYYKIQFAKVTDQYVHELIIITKLSHLLTIKFLINRPIC